MALRSGRVGIHPSQVDPITGMLLNGPTPGSISFNDLSDVQISNPEVGQTLIYKGTGWENEFSSISPTTLAALQDVQITDPEDGALLVYDSASNKWVNSVTPPAPIVPDGNTVTPTDDVETWLSCAGIDDKSYTTLSDILSDSIIFNALLGDSNANKYMARSTTWASTLCADQYAMTMIGQYDVCCDALLGNSTWASAIGSSTYMEYVLNTKVPTMTSNTTPSGECSASSEYDNNAKAYKAFDGNDSTEWATLDNQGVGSWLKYEFPSTVVISYFKLHPKYYAGNGGLYLKEYKIQGSNDDFVSDIHDLYSETLPNEDVGTIDRYFANDTAYKYYRLLAVSTYITTYNIVNICTLQFYGHAEQTDKIHGANEEVAYYLDGATQVPISNPSTLDAGTYTFGSTIAKNPDSLSSDYTKQIRITPNTVEVVLRPDKSLYWWGYISSDCDALSTYIGYSGITFQAPTFNTNYVRNAASSGSYSSGIGSKTARSMTKTHTIAQGISGSGYGNLVASTSQNITNTSAYVGTIPAISSTNLAHISDTFTETSCYLFVSSSNNRSSDIYALWYE